MIDRAVAGGWEHRRACAYLELDDGRAWRWRRRRDADCLGDRKPGSAVHGLRPEEVTAILELFERWGDVDRSHRKLAHRGSYIGEVWVSPATVRRVLAARDLRAAGEMRAVVDPSITTPRWKEQFGRVAVQAMAHGAAVIASDSGSLGEVVSDAGVLVPEGDVQRFARELRQLLDDSPRRAELSERGRRRAIEQFSWDVVADKSDRMYRELLASGGLLPARDAVR